MTIYLEQTNYLTYFDFIEYHQENDDLLSNAILATYEYNKQHDYPLDLLVIIELRNGLFAVSGITNEWLPKEINSNVRLFDSTKRAMEDIELQIYIGT